MNTHLNNPLDEKAYVSKSWPELIQVSYNIVCKGDPENPHNLNPYTAHSLLEASIGQYFVPVADIKSVYTPCKSEKVGLSEFYQKTFGPATNFAKHIFNSGISIQKDCFAVLPARTQYNNGLPVGLRYLTPKSIQMLAVSENHDGYDADDILLLKYSQPKLLQPAYAVLTPSVASITIKTVPELPQEMIDFANEQNMLLR